MGDSGYDSQRRVLMLGDEGGSGGSGLGHGDATMEGAGGTAGATRTSREAHPRVWRPLCTALGPRGLRVRPEEDATSGVRWRWQTGSARTVGLG